jgi:hypothetical protein
VVAGALNAAEGGTTRMRAMEQKEAPGHRRPLRREGVAHELAEDGTVALFDRAGLRLLVLDPIGSGVWSLADGSHTRDDIVDELLAVFQVPRAQVVDDVDRFLDALAADSLLDFV